MQAVSAGVWNPQDTPRIYARLSRLESARTRECNLVEGLGVSLAFSFSQTILLDWARRVTVNILW